MPVQQNLDLLARLAYLQAGGRDPGQRDIDKLNQTFQTIGNTGKTIMDYVTTDAALKKAELERQKLKNELQPMYQLGVGESPSQTAQRTSAMFEKPISKEEMFSGTPTGKYINPRTGQETISPVEGTAFGPSKQEQVYGPQNQYKPYQEELKNVPVLERQQYDKEREDIAKQARSGQLTLGQAYVESQIDKNLREKKDKTFNVSDLTPAAQRIYLQVPGRTIGDLMSKEEFLENEKYARALISGGVGQKEENIILSKIMDELPKLESAALSSKNAYSSINQALGLIKEGVTGKAGQAKAILAQYQDFFPGEDIKNLDDAQTFQLLTRAIVGPMRLDIVGPGPVSEYEQKLMQQISGGGGASRGAADALLNYYKKLAVNKVNAYNSRLSGASKLNESISGLFNKVELEDKKEVKPSGPKMKNLQYKSADEVKKAYQEGKIDKETARNIIKLNFDIGGKK